MLKKTESEYHLPARASWTHALSRIVRWSFRFHFSFMLFMCKCNCTKRDRTVATSCNHKSKLFLRVATNWHYSLDHSFTRADMQLKKKGMHCIYLHKGTRQGSPPARSSSQTEAWSRRSWNARRQRWQAAAGFLFRPPHAAKCRMSCWRPRRTPPPSSHGEASLRASPAPSAAAKMRSRRTMASLSCRYTCWDARSLSHLSFLCQEKQNVETDVSVSGGLEGVCVLVVLVVDLDFGARLDFGV